MQPAVADDVQSLTVPASATTAGERRGARMSIPWCGPPARGSPKSSVYETVPTTGKIRRGTGLLGDAAAPATSENVRTTGTRAIRTRAEVGNTNRRYGREHESRGRWR